TIVASAILFQGFNESNPVNLVSLFCGFFTTFVGVFLLNSNPHCNKAVNKLPIYDKGCSKPGSSTLRNLDSISLDEFESEDEFV
ncbi:hypothetical protein K7432_015866, partial [Basidiobolus ranarum]